MCFHQFKVVNQVSDKISIYQNGGLTRCAKAALVSEHLKQQGLNPGALTEAEFESHASAVNIGCYLANLGDLVVSLPQDCPLLKK